MHCSSCQDTRRHGWRACRSLPPQGLLTRIFKFSGVGSVEGCNGDVGCGGENPPHMSHLLPPAGQCGSRLPFISQSRSSPAGRCAACYLTWLSGSSSAHCCTQSRSPVMIYCLAAYTRGAQLRGVTFWLTLSWYENSSVRQGMFESLVLIFCKGHHCIRANITVVTVYCAQLNHGVLFYGSAGAWDSH